MPTKRNLTSHDAYLLRNCDVSSFPVPLTSACQPNFESLKPQKLLVNKSFAGLFCMLMSLRFSIQFEYYWIFCNIPTSIWSCSQTRSSCVKQCTEMDHIAANKNCNNSGIQSITCTVHSKIARSLVVYQRFRNFCILNNISICHPTINLERSYFIHWKLPHTSIQPLTLVHIDFASGNSSIVGPSTIDTSTSLPTFAKSNSRKLHLNPRLCNFQNFCSPNLRIFLLGREPAKCLLLLYFLRLLVGLEPSTLQTVQNFH